MIQIPSVERPTSSITVMDAFANDSGKKSVCKAWDNIRDYIYQLEAAQLGQWQVRARKVTVNIPTPRGIEYTTFLVEVDASGSVV